MRYEGKLYRPPSEARSYIVQATIGCSHNLCTYCDMYRDKQFRVRELDEVLEDIAEAGRRYRGADKVFVADGDALVLDLDHWEAILTACREAFPHLKRVSAYATAMNVNSDWMSSVQPRRSGEMVIAAVPASAGPAPMRPRARTYHPHANAQALRTGTIANRSRSGPQTAMNGARTSGNPHGYAGGLKAGPSDCSTAKRFSARARPGCPEASPSA